jgi:hypothetical protein
MIGPAEIEDMLAEYEDAMRDRGLALPTQMSWPVTLPPPTAALPYDEALQRIRNAMMGTDPL